MPELSNDILTIKINEKGAELYSIFSNERGNEYMWNADPQYWNRHSPVLFPIVGSLWNGEFRLNDKTYNLPQHGFARDMDFKIVKKTGTEIIFKMENTPQVNDVYPFSFILHIGYELKDKTIRVSWNIENTGEEKMFFQIGAHPGFYYPDFNPEEKLKGYLQMDIDKFEYALLGKKGCIPYNDKKIIESQNRLYPIFSDTFDNQAMIIENSQISKISLLDHNKKPYLSVRFDAPVVGLWSPPYKNAPFICLEPWFGRCDYIGYEGDFRDKEWMNSLDVTSQFYACYYIDIDN